jgi:DNA-binding LacI/PurR family transcriptional regulator
LQGAESIGRRVPGDLSIICFDNATVAPFVPFRPTFIDIRPQEMSAQAARMLLNMLRECPADPPQVLLAPRLVEGSTTGPAPQGKEKP